MAEEKEKNDAPKYPLGLSATVPVLNVKPSKEPVCTIVGGFDFEVEYDYRGDKNFYVALAMHDLRKRWSALWR
ncbi:MAG: hypothetical protein ACLRYR_00715 [Bifidobacterium dentium]